MRFLIVPNLPNAYDQRMGDSLASALRQLGQEARTLPSPINDADAAAISQNLDIDVLLQVNRFRPVLNPLPDKVRHIAWFQDIFPDTLGDVHSRIRPGDIVYALGDPSVLGLNVSLPCHVGTLLTGADENIQAPPSQSSERIDFSLCGYIPPPFDYVPSLPQDVLWYFCDSIRRFPILGSSLPVRGLLRVLLRRYQKPGHAPFAVVSAFRSTVESSYRPLCGELDIYALARAMHESIAPVLAKQRPRRARRAPRKKKPSDSRFDFVLSPYARAGASATGQPEIDSFVRYFAREYPRLLDRQMLVRSALNVSSSIELYGDGWKDHKEFLPFYKGFIAVQGELYDVYRRTRINLMNNTHGLGLHSRTLECMAVGGFIFAHRSPNDCKPGGMETTFDPGVHYGAFTPDTFEEEARRWLVDEEARNKVGRAATEIVRQKHLWRHRAQQILDDMKR